MATRLAPHHVRQEKSMSTEGAGSTPPKIRRLMTLDETAEVLRRTPSQMRWMISQKKAPPHAKIGGRVMFDADALADWIDAQFQK